MVSLADKKIFPERRLAWLAKRADNDSGPSQIGKLIGLCTDSKYPLGRNGLGSVLPIKPKTFLNHDQLYPV